MPAEVIDPASGFTATLIDVIITSVTGLPYGIQFTLNDDDATFHPSAGENYGCATMCGTPLLPGTYNVIITVTANVQVSVFNATQVETFISTIVVEPGVGTANTFSYDNIANCGGLEVNYEALFTAPEPSVTSYSWDFGNDQISSDATPNTVTYDEPGEYVAVLTTTISDYALTGVSVSNLNDNWGGDEDFFTGPADPYFTVIDGNANVIYTSATNDNVTNTSWMNPQLILSSPPYYIQFFDEDDITADDDLGTTPIDITPGDHFFDIGNGTVGIISVGLQVTNEFVDSVTVTVFPSANAELLQAGNTLYLTDPTLSTFVWYQNDISINDAFDSSYVMTSGGVYYAEVTNDFGCTATTNPVVYCPEITLTYDDAAMELYVDDIYETYQWYYNGLPMDGETTFYIQAIDAGNYALDIATDYGCETTSEVYTLVVGVDEKSPREKVIAFPNPAEDILVIQNNSNEIFKSIAIYDLTGRMINSFNTTGNQSRIEIPVQALTPGIYFATLNNKKIRFIKK